MLDEEKALKLTKAKDLLLAAKEAETRNCTQELIRELYRRYYKAVELENEKLLGRR